MRRAREHNLPLREYSQLRYSPGKGIVVEESGTRIMVGTRALFEEQGVIGSGERAVRRCRSQWCWQNCRAGRARPRRFSAP